MMTTRFLPILNLVGCILVTGVIFFQWRKEQNLDKRIRAISRELVTSRHQTADAEKHVVALEGDVAQLKSALFGAAERLLLAA